MEASGLPIIRVFKRNKNLILLAVPVFLELMLSVAMGYVNQFLLSGIPLASNAVSQSNQITNIFVVSFSVLSNSSLILLSQLLGKKNEEEAVGRIYSLSLIINLVLGVIVAGICIGIAFFVFPLMGVDEAVIPYAIRYQIVSAPSLIFQALTNVFSSFFFSFPLYTYKLKNTTSKMRFLPLYKQRKEIVSVSAPPIIKKEGKAWNGITSPSPT